MESKIGEAAGKVWKTLHEKGAMPAGQLSKLVGISPDLTNQAIGWLAREGKLVEQSDSKSKEIKLKLK
jgi:hypothetical protein